MTASGRNSRLILRRFVGAFVVSLLNGSVTVTAVLFAVAVAEYVAATVIYKYLCRKM